MTEPVRWGFLGAGWIAAKALAPAVHQTPNAVLHAVAARDAGRAQALGPAGPVYPRYADLLADPDVDAVYVALANHQHRPWVVSALEAGKHVLCEKPLGLTAVEVAQMVAAAEAADRLLVEASFYRWHPQIRLVQRLLAEDTVGRVCHVAAGFTFAGVGGGNYRLDADMGGGALYDVGCYAISAALWAFGESPTEVAATATLGPTGVDLTTEALLTFPGGSAEIRASIDEPPRQWLIVTGEAGEVELPESAYTAWWGADTEVLVSDGRGTERIPVPATDSYRLMVEDVSTAVQGGPAYLLPVRESLETARVIDAAFAAARSGEPVRP